MDFTSLYPTSSSSASTSISPDGTLILAASGTLLILRDAVTFHVVKSWSLSVSLSGKNAGIYLEFAHDAAYILVVHKATATAWIFSVHSDSTDALMTVQAGTAEGMHAARFISVASTGKRYVATWAACRTRLTLYDLETGTANVITSPKHGVSQGWAIRPCRDTGITNPTIGQIFALLERRNGKDALALYDLEELTLIRYIPLATVDAAEISWSPCGSYIVVLEGVLRTIVHILSAAGRPIATYDPDASTPPLGMGFSNAAWQPLGGHLILSRADDSVHILDMNSWRCGKIVRMPWSQWTMPKAASEGHARVQLSHHREPVDWLKPTKGQEPPGIVDFVQTNLSASRISALVKTVPSAITHRPVQAKAPTQLGLLHMSLSNTGRHVALVSALQPRLLLLCHFSNDEHLSVSLRAQVSCVVECNQAIQGLAWQPSSMVSGKPDILAIATSEKSLILWRESSENKGNRNEVGSVEAVGVPTKSTFRNNSLAWSPDGASILLQGESSFCLAYPHEA